MLPPDKKELRRIMRERRAALHTKNPNAANALCDRFLAEMKLPSGAVIAGYIAADHEIDPAPLMEALHKRGHKLALPVLSAENLSFRSYAPGDALAPEHYAIPEPVSTAVPADPDVVLVPLLAFDRQGHRLGRGGGHYDRTLENLRKRCKISAIGLAFSGQQVDAIPAESHDARLDKIVTEIEVISVVNPC